MRRGGVDCGENDMNGIDGDQIYRDVLRWIPPSAATVLEIGCGTGQLARSYKQINPFVSYMGIELSEID